MIVKELFAKLGLEVDEGAFSVGEKAISILKDGLIAVGATVTGVALGLAALAKKTADAGASASRAAQQAGVSTGAWQELAFAAEASGVSSEALQTSLRRLARTAYDASRGGAEAGDAFRVLGISATDASGKLKTPDALLGDLAERFAHMPDGMKKSALAMELFGRGGSQLLPFLNKGRDGIEALREEARELGIVLDADTIKAGKHFKKALHEAEGAVQGLGYAIGGPLIEAFTPALEAIALWVKNNREFIAAKVHEAVTAFAGAVRAVWTVAGPLVKIIGKLLTNTILWRLAAVALGTYLTLLAGQKVMALVSALRVAAFWFNAVGLAGVKAAASAMAAWVAAALPIAAVIAAAALVFLLLEDLYQFLTGGDSLIGEFASKLEQLLPKAWDHVVSYFREQWEAFVKWATDKFSFFSNIMKFVSHIATPGSADGPTGAADDYGAMFGSGASSPDASVAATPAQGGGSVQVRIGDINVTSKPGADGREVGNDVADAVEERQRTMLREAQVAVVSG